MLGADLRFNAHLRAYGEIGTGQVDGRYSAVPANFQNDASLQQLFVDARGYLAASWAVSEHLTLFFDYEFLAAGDVLARAGLPSGTVCLASPLAARLKDATAPSGS